MIPLQDDNPSTLRPLVTITFVVACVLVFLWQFSLGPVRGQQIAGMLLIPFFKHRQFRLHTPWTR